MQKSTIRAIVILIAWSVGLGACRGNIAPDNARAATPTVTPVKAAEVRVITAEGRVVPAQHATLAFKVGGRVIAIPVHEGEQVKAGTVLARLDDALLQAQTAQAQATVELAQKQFAQLQAGGTAEQIASAQSALNAAQANHDKVKQGPTIDQIAQLKANLDNARAALDQAQSAYDRAGGTSNPSIGLTRESLQLQQASNAYHAALAAFDDARSHPTVAELTAAYSQLEQAKEALARLTPTQPAMDVSQAQVAQTKAAVDLARMAAQDAVLTAPFDGMVGTINMDVGQVISPGTPVATFGDLSKLQVETTDLTEVDVTKLVVGQTANLTIDALSSSIFKGQIVRIATEANAYRGDQVYKVTIDLPNATSAGLRWGMTASVSIPANQ